MTAAEWIEALRVHVAEVRSGALDGDAAYGLRAYDCEEIAALLERQGELLAQEEKKR